MLRRTGCLCRMGRHHLHCQIGLPSASIELIGLGLWSNPSSLEGMSRRPFVTSRGGTGYWAISDIQATRCYQTRERQTLERVDLYAWRESPSDPLLINVTPLKINNDIPSDGKLWRVVDKFTNGQVAGASGMCTKHIKGWLQGIWWEEDPDGRRAEGAGDSWCLFVWLVQAAWTNGMIPLQLHWSIVVLIPKGGGDYRGIRLLESIWKYIKCVIDHCLRHFQNVHPLDLIIVPKEGCYSRCERYGMQVNPLYPCHWFLKECQVGVEHCISETLFSTR